MGGNFSDIPDRIPPLDRPCMCCPVQVRGLFGVAFNLLNLRGDPDRWQRKIGERLDELQAAVNALQPFIDAHFEDRAHAEATNLSGARDGQL